MPLLPRTLSSTHLCPVESQYPLRERMYRRYTAELLQALWRGYKTRKDLKKKDREIVREWASHVEELDQEYRLMALAQTMAIHLRSDDPAWDPQSTYYYQMMLEIGRRIDSYETWLFKKGWVRPPQKPLNPEAVGAWMAEAYRKYGY